MIGFAVGAGIDLDIDIGTAADPEWVDEFAG